MSINSKKIKRQMSIDFTYDWFQGTENKEKWTKTIRTQLQKLFPVYPHRSHDNRFLNTLLAEISKEFMRKKNTLSFGDLARSATNHQALFPVVYGIKAYDIFSITVNSLTPCKIDKDCYRMELTMHFERELTFPTNPYSHEHERVTIAFIIDDQCNFLQKASINKPPSSTCTLL
jgi:hypothetical protein